MNYAFWIAVLVVLIAVLPALIKKAKGDKHGDQPKDPPEG